MDRRTGKTTRALAALPDGAIYVVSHRGMLDYCRRLLVSADRRPDALRLIVLSSINTALMGLPRSTVLDFDHFCYEVATGREREMMRRFRDHYALPPVVAH